MTDLRRKIWTLIRGGSFRGYLRTVSGYPVTLADCMADKPVSLAVSGNAVQDGTPTPDNPVEVLGCGDRTGNLFDADSAPVITGVVDRITLIFTEIYGTAYTYFNCLPNTTYTISKLPQGGIYCLADTPPAIGKKCRTRFASDSDAGITISRATITTGENDTYIWISLIASTGGEYSAEEMVSSIQIENEGTTALPYEPYGYKVPLRFSGRNLFNKDKFVELVKQYDTTAYEDTIDGRHCIVFSNTSLHAKDFSEVAQFGNSVYTMWMDIKNVVPPAVGSGTLYIGYLYNDEPYTTNIASAYPSVDASNRCRRLAPSDCVDFKAMTITSAHTDEVTATGFAFSFGTVSRWAIDLDSIMLEQSGTVTPYEPYHAPITFPIYLDAPLYGNGDVSDTVELDVEHRTATLTRRITISDTGEIAASEPTTTDISGKIDWDSIPTLWRGTVIVSADTTVEPSNITAKYYANKPEEVNNIAVR